MPNIETLQLINSISILPGSINSYVTAIVHAPSVRYVDVLWPMLWFGLSQLFAAALALGVLSHCFGLLHIFTVRYFNLACQLLIDIQYQLFIIVIRIEALNMVPYPIHKLLESDAERSLTTCPIMGYRTTLNG
jgi:hypothetical protein